MNKFLVSYYDIKIKKKVHALVIPKGKYVNLENFTSKATSAEIVGLMKGISTVAKKIGISSIDNGGFRTLSNVGENGGQEVPHLHFHIIGGEKIGRMVQ